MLRELPPAPPNFKYRLPDGLKKNMMRVVGQLCENIVGLKKQNEFSLARKNWKVLEQLMAFFPKFFLAFNGCYSKENTRDLET